MGNDHCRPGDYKEPVLPEGVLEIRVSVYKLELTGVAWVDNIGAGVAGLYHSGLVVAGHEWAFGAHDQKGKTGVYRTRPEINPDYIFYQRLIMGQVRLSQEDLLLQIRALASAPSWSGTSYDLIERNCNHFASDLCWLLLKKRPPDWINETAESMASTRRRKRAEDTSFAGALNEFRAKHRDQDPDSISGLKAFEDTFRSTFELAWIRSSDFRQSLLAGSQDGDLVGLRLQVESDSFDAAGAAAGTAALVVAAAAQMAAKARASQLADGLDAWDAAWIMESGPLLGEWREAAVSGDLQSGGEPERARQLEAALAFAAAAAETAADAKAKAAADVVTDVLAKTCTASGEAI